MVLLSENPCQHSPHWALAEPLHDLVGECVRGEIGTAGYAASLERATRSRETVATRGIRGKVCTLTT